VSFTERNGLLTKIERNPVAAYFLFAFLITWTFWFLAPSLAIFGPKFVGFGIQIGSFGPVYAAILVSTIVDPKPSNIPATKRRLTFAMALVIMVLVQLLATYAVGSEITFQTVLFSVFYAVIAAYVISSIYHPRNGVANLLSGLKRISVRNAWLWIALLLPFVWQFIGAGVDLSLGGKELFTLTPPVLFSLVGYFPYIVFFGGGLNEEPGWRGFAVPRLQRTLSPVVAGLIIGIIWSTWHLPLHATNVIEGGLSSFPFRFVYNVPLGVLFSWFYNKSDANLLACVLLHASYNSAGSLFGNNSALVSIALMILFTAAVAVHDRMWQKRQTSQAETINLTINT
jgi:CAAX protease family protein